MRILAAPTALIAIAVAIGTISTSPAHAEIVPTPGTREVPNDVPFHFARGDHLDMDEEVPTTSRYGRGRPIFLVGDSQAAQLADGVLRVAKAQHRALLPRTRAATKMHLPARDTSAGRWSARIFEQIQNRRHRRPIVILSGWYPSVERLRETISELRDNADAKVLVVTSIPIADRRYSYCVARALREGRRPNRVCRWRVENRGVGSAESLRAARLEGVPSLNLLPRVARGDGATHPPVAKNVFIHRNPNHLTATFARRLLYEPLRKAIKRAD